MPHRPSSSFLFDSLGSTDSAQNFLACSYNPRVELQLTSDPRIIWYNPRCNSLPDPSSCLAKKIGLKINVTSQAEVQIGVVDRYGGRGLGRNGGSGRSALVGDLYLKGIGQTPLLGMSTDSTHLSGGAYLEECAREVVISEVVSAEFPWGCVPVSALCLTGESVVWSTQTGEKTERQCILARPPFIRPAHFERAIGFDPCNLNDISIDGKRVLSSLEYLQSICPNEEVLLAELNEFWSRWSEQIAYGFVHRLTSGGLSTANVSIDGRWVDFGSWASLPSWGRYAFAPRVESFGEEFIAFLQCIREFHASLNRQNVCTTNLDSLLQITQERCTASFERRMSFEFLRVFGLSRKQAQGLLQSSHAQDVLRGLADFIANYQRENLSIIYETEVPSLPWCPESFWSNGKKQPRSLAGIIGNSLGIFADDESAHHAFAVILERARFIGRPRASLYRDQLKKVLYETLESECIGEKLTADSFASIINSIICHSRRDSFFEHDDAICVGFARSSMCGMVLFYNIRHKIYQAVIEWSLQKKYSTGNVVLLGAELSSGLALAREELGEFNYCLSGPQGLCAIE